LNEDDLALDNGPGGSSNPVLSQGRSLDTGRPIPLLAMHFLVGAQEGKYIVSRDSRLFLMYTASEEPNQPMAF